MRIGQKSGVREHCKSMEDGERASGGLKKYLKETPLSWNFGCIKERTVYFKARVSVNFVFAKLLRWCLHCTGLVPLAGLLRAGIIRHRLPHLTKFTKKF